MMITVYGYPGTRSVRVVWMLEELGVEYQYRLVNLMKGEARQPAYLTLNPAGKVPAVQIDDVLLTESAAIVTYLGDLHPASGLVPPTGTPERAHYDQWMSFAITELEQPLWTMAKHKFALPEKHRVSEVLPTAAWELQVALALLSEGLGDKPYLLGDNISAVDLMVAQTLGWARAFKQEIKQDNLNQYADRLLGRHARSKAIERELEANT